MLLPLSYKKEVTIKMGVLTKIGEGIKKAGHYINERVEEAAQANPEAFIHLGEPGLENINPLYPTSILYQDQEENIQNDDTTPKSGNSRKGKLGVTGLTLCVLSALGASCGLPGDGHQAYEAPLVPFNGSVGWGTYTAEYTPVDSTKRLVQTSIEFDAFMFRTKKENEGNYTEDAGGVISPIDGPLYVPDVNGDGMIGQPR
jgi:hypothetical protein